MIKRSKPRTIIMAVLLLMMGLLAVISLIIGLLESSGDVKPAQPLPPAATVPAISPAEAKKRADSGEKVIFLDVRTPDEYRTSHIPGSILLPVDEVEARAALLLPDKEMPIFVYCRSGRRSERAARTLMNLGYQHVYNLGGLRDWPYEIVKL